MDSSISGAACNQSALATSSRITAGNGGRFFSCRSRSSAAWLPGASGTNFPLGRVFTLRPSSENICFSRQQMEVPNTYFKRWNECYLDQQPSDYRIDDRNFVNVTSF